MIVPFTPTCSSSTDGQEDATNQEGADSLAVLLESRRRDGTIGSVEVESTCFSESEGC